MAFRHLALKAFDSASVLLLLRRTVKMFSSKESSFARAWVNKSLQEQAANKLPIWTRQCKRTGQQRLFVMDNRGFMHFAIATPSRTSVLLKKVRIAMLGGTAACGAFYLHFSEEEEVPYTRRRHSLMFTSHNIEEELGEEQFENDTSEAHATGKLLPADHPAVQRVRGIGLKIVAVAAQGRGGGNYQFVQKLKWDFAVVENNQVNAYVVPGGKVVVYTGLLDMMEKDDEVAAVLAHEVGHVLARHTGEGLDAFGVYSIVQAFLLLYTGLVMPNFLYSLGYVLPSSRLHEHEADAIGVHLMAQAGFDPQGNISMLKKFQAMDEKHEAESEDMDLDFLRTHPPSADRVREVERYLPTLMHDSFAGVAVH